MYQKRNNWFEIISLFNGAYARSLYLRQISKLSKIPLKTTQNLLNDLEKKKILKSNLQGKNKYFMLNLENIQTKFYILLSETYKTIKFLEKYPNFKTFLKEIPLSTCLIVFGSFAKLNEHEESDVDMLVISEKDKKIPSHLLPNEIHKITISCNSFIRSLKEQETLIKEIEENHVILNNHSFYVNAMWDNHEK